MSADIEVPPKRQAALHSVVRTLLAADRIVLTTHVNADGDGAGSEAAIAHWLRGLGRTVHIVNPTAFPDLFRYLIDDDSIVLDAGTVAADRALADADLLVVVDTAEAKRIGRVARAAETMQLAIIDHHVEGDVSLRGVTVQDVTACATAELVYDLLVSAGLPRPWPQPVLEAIYTGITTDTGSFRFANTTRRTHELAGDLIEQGVNPELMYRRIYATVPLHRVQLLRHALEHLEVDPDYPITSITIERGIMEALGAGSDDLEGVVEHARAVEGTEVAILFRETADGSTKISLRSAGDIDVNTIARQFGGGGHVKASGALIAGPFREARERVLTATRSALGTDFRRTRGAS
ncbi:MAG: bifunctional oligoribonuclease/PAP phosphatase NrnA [Gemmatimonadota bacterium]